MRISVRRSAVSDTEQWRAEGLLSTVRVCSCSRLRAYVFVNECSPSIQSMVYNTLLLRIKVAIC